MAKETKTTVVETEAKKPTRKRAANSVNTFPILS